MMRRPVLVYRVRCVRPRLARWCLASCAIAALLALGCRRADFRLRADKETYRILNKKTAGTPWDPPRLDITPDPRSRFFDPYDLDFPPLPPDDPAAHEYMHEVHGMKGWKHWYDNGTLSHAENPVWPAYFDGELLQGPQFPLPSIDSVGLEEALELGLIHSREYQEQLENMYLAALDLTFQRYRFDVRPLGFLGEPGASLFYDHQPDDASNLDGGVNLGISRLLPSGAQFVAELTNNTLWLFSGPNATQTATTFAYSLVAPLLEGGRREIALENLTQAERRVLYAIRDFERFRKDFYVTIVTGERALPLPGSAGGGELAFLIRGERSPTVGFYFLLFSLQRVRNQETNVRSLESLIRDLERLGEAGRVATLDITQLRSSLATARRRYILLSRFYQDQLDRFKVQLGLPPDIELRIDDEIIEPFQFLNTELLQLESQLSGVLIDSDPSSWAQLVQQLRELNNRLSELLLGAEEEISRLETLLPARAEALDADASKRLHQDFLRDQQRFAEVSERVAAEFHNLDALAQRLSDRLQPRDAAAFLAGVRQARRSLLRSVRELTGLQIGLRVELVMLQPVALTQQDVVHLALNNRLDLMNRRGILVDTRRKLEVAADRLEASLDIVAEGEVSTPPLLANSQPFDFRVDRSNFRAGVSLVTPLDRKAARNNFRAAQVSYQRARRNYMAAEDQVKLDVRAQLRDVVAQAAVFETNRQALRVAALELDQAVEFSERPDVASGAGNQGVNISRALDNILDAQDELIESWADYETARLSLYRDMGIMLIDEDGRWVEDVPQHEAVPLPSGDYSPPETESDFTLRRLPEVNW